MKPKLRFITLGIAILIIFNSTFIFITPTCDAEPQAPEDFPPVLGWILENIFKAIWYNVGSGPTPKYFFAEPSLIVIDYLGNATVDLVWGVEDSERKQYHRFQPQVFTEFRIEYEAVFPDEIQENAFNVVFDPPLYDVVEYDKQVGGTNPNASQPTTKLYLSLERPSDPGNPIEDFILKINVSIYRKFGDIITVFGFLPSFLSGIWKANYAADVGHKTFEIFVKIKPFNYVDLVMPQPVYMHINDLKSTRIKLTNLGSHVRQFGFRAKNNSGSLLVNTPPPITLYPGETGYAQVGLVSKPVAYDRGTLHSVEIEVFACENESVILEKGVLNVKTQGFAIQGIFSFKYSWHLFFASIFIIFILLIYWIFKRIKIGSSCKKPKKPWALPKEKQHLKNLLKENKKGEYKSTMEMMKQEYASSLLWYKYFRKSLIKKERKKGKLIIFLINLKNSILKFFKNLVNKIKNILQERKEKKLKLEEQKVVEEQIEEEKPEEPPETKEEQIFEEEDLETKIKDKSLRKIQKQQEKQKRKIKKKPLGNSTNFY